MIEPKNQTGHLYCIHNASGYKEWPTVGGGAGRPQAPLHYTCGSCFLNAPNINANCRTVWKVFPLVRLAVRSHALRPAGLEPATCGLEIQLFFFSLFISNLLFVNSLRSHLRFKNRLKLALFRRKPNITANVYGYCGQ